MNTHFFAQTPSTNIEAKNLAEQGAEHGTVVWAAEQTAGRGRLGKSWTSLKGKGLYLSIILRPQITFEHFAKLTLVVGVSTADFLRQECAGTPYKAEQIAIKWPNDIFINGKKIAGILAESSPQIPDTKSFVIVGIGINISHAQSDFPQDLRVEATSLTLETGKQYYSFKSLLHHLHTIIMADVKCFEQEGFLTIIERWRQLDYLKGREMECINTAGKIIRGIALGVDDNGILHLQDEDKKIHEVLSGDIGLLQ